MLKFTNIFYVWGQFDFSSFNLLKIFMIKFVTNVYVSDTLCFFVDPTPTYISSIPITRLWKNMQITTKSHWLTFWLQRLAVASPFDLCTPAKMSNPM